MSYKVIPTDYRGKSSINKLTNDSDLRSNVVLVLFVIWSISQTVMAMQFLSFELVSTFNYLKSIVPAMIIFVSMLLYFDKIRSNVFFMPFLLFGLFAFTNTSFHIIIEGSKDWMQLSQPTMTIMWVICMFGIVPVAFDSFFKIQRFLLFTTGVTLLLVLISSLWAFLHGYDVMKTYGGSRAGGIRYSFAYQNPTYMAGILYSILVGFLMLKELVTIRWQKILIIAILCIAAIGIFMTDSRTYFLATFILLFFYVRGWGGFYKLISWLILVSIVSFILYSLFDKNITVTEINSMSSNRIQIWIDTFDQLMSDGMEEKILTGIGLYAPEWDQSINLAEGSVSKSFTRLAIDNVYMEVFVLHGLIGFVLFVRAIMILINKLQKIRKLINNCNERRLKKQFDIAYGAIVSISISAFFCSHFPSLGNTLNSIVFPAAISLIFVIEKTLKEIDVTTYLSTKPKPVYLH